VTIGAALFSSAKQAWNTPDVVLAPVRAFAPIILDPCSNAESIVRARFEWRIERGEDGLRRPWFDFDAERNERGCCFVNPPYEDLEEWARKIYAEGLGGTQMLVLIPARTETRAFQDYLLPRCGAVCFWKGRIAHGVGSAPSSQRALFAGDAPPMDAGEHTAPFPSVVLYFGTRPGGFARVFELYGQVLKPWRQP
jgi:hypothetical protein